MIQLLGKNGSGKTYLANKLFEIGFKKNIGYTTRGMRFGEINDFDYHFISILEFEKLINQGFFSEYKVRNGDYYGMSFKDLGDDVIIIGGNKKVIESNTNININTFYIETSLDKRFQRMIDRKDEYGNIIKRIHEENFSYLYDFETIIVDNEEEKGVSNLLSVIDSDDKINYSIYIRELIENFKFKKNYNGIECILECEENILRKLWLSNCDKNKRLKSYLEEMKKILIYYDCNYVINDDSFDIIEDDKVYKLNYIKKERR